MKKIISIICVVILLTTITLSGCNEQKKPIIATFEVVPNEIDLGRNAKLHWIVSNATSITIDQGIGIVNHTGILSISPTEDTIYTLTAKSSTTTVTATTSIIVNVPLVTMAQFKFYLEIMEIKNNQINQSEINIIAKNQNNSENQTSLLQPTVTEGNGNLSILGIGDFITFHNLSDFSIGEIWDIEMINNGEIIARGIFKNPQGPYDTPEVRMTQSASFITIIGIINGPINQTLCSIIAINATSGMNQTSLIGAAFVDRDNNPAVLQVLDQISFSNLGNVDVGEKWQIQFVYKGAIIGRCKFINPTKSN